MKKLIVLFFLIAYYASCEKEKTCVRCEYYEECDNGACVIQDDFVKIGDRVFRGKENLFVGRAESSSCIDTVAFKFTFFNTSHYLYIESKNEFREAFYKEDAVPFELVRSANSFHLPIINNLESFCTQNEEDWTASVLVTTHLPDSISMDFGFYRYGIDTLVPRPFLEINRVVLYPLLQDE